MEIREGDVFRFIYNEHELAKRFMPYHCFDGQLVAVLVDGDMLLTDTYWSHQLRGGDGRTFTPDDAQKQGAISFVCNLNDVEFTSKSAFDYYDDVDVFDLSYQHHCYGMYALRKGAKRSKDKMIDTVTANIESARRDLQDAVNRLESLAVKLHEIESGNIDGIYI